MVNLFEEYKAQSGLTFDSPYVYVNSSMVFCPIVSPVPNEDNNPMYDMFHPTVNNYMGDLSQKHMFFLWVASSEGKTDKYPKNWENRVVAGIVAPTIVKAMMNIFNTGDAHFNAITEEGLKPVTFTENGWVIVEDEPPTFFNLTRASNNGITSYTVSQVMPKTVEKVMKSFPVEPEVSELSLKALAEEHTRYQQSRSGNTVEEAPEGF